MRTEEFISHSRRSFALLRWAPLVAALALPFTFSQGPIPRIFAVGAIPIAAVWLSSLLLAWRTGRHVWFGFGFIALLLGSRVVGVNSPEVPLPQFIQWLCLVVILAGAPLLFFRTRLLLFAHLDEPTKVA